MKGGRKDGWKESGLKEGRKDKWKEKRNEGRKAEKINGRKER